MPDEVTMADLWMWAGAIAAMVIVYGCCAWANWRRERKVKRNV